ncbi:DUF255 domain-containing protein [Thiohalobacter thiocyanaticus]|uniref:DUF255 domain-containing protein n=1 Tax=Thiohalobacter thiocyanaticus TaxID=585455 RepID=A0A426QKW8_9GAMM|nr:DUF255 domain-containing protein [Thiohalobacter thiocyanaticus]RRQ22402.1 DUF255 domain-containing protein [Thiohalobacter thiocyanaticus]
MFRLIPLLRRILPGLVALTLVVGLVSAAQPQGQNRLATESSPYLLQHADNPVDWYPWGEAAFVRAREEDKFIFLSVGYSTCHWCHVMKRESFSDPDIAALLNEHAVSVKVDREERPDVDAIYMTAQQLMTGRGGWPMTLLLTPELEPFFAAVYLPPGQLRELILRAQTMWEEERGVIERRAARVMAQMHRATGLPDAAAERLPGTEVRARAVAALAGTFDPFDGGFGPPPRFPLPSNLQLLLSHDRISGDAGSREMLTTTLDGMARGGIFDQVGGGFHRYATDPQWLVPHFEKMLYDNAQLLHVYARAWEHTDDPDYRRVAESIAAWVQREMTGPDGLFYSARDAEVAGKEGASYVWTRAQLRELLTETEYDLATRVWGLTGPPNFDEAYILHWPRDPAETATAMDLTVAELHERLERIRVKLLTARERRPQPQLDDKAVTAWNGMMIEALAHAGEVLEREDYIQRAERAAAALLEVLRDEDGRLLHVARAGRGRIAAYLDDYAAVILGLLALDRTTDAPRWRAAAESLGDAMIDTLWDPAGGFHYAEASVDHLIVRPRASRDGAMPAPNSLAVRALVGLARQIDARFAGHAAATLRAYAPVLEDDPAAMPHMLWALAEYRAAGLDEQAAPMPVEYTPPDTADVVRARARVDDTDPRRLVVTLQLKPGWHVNATPASLDFLIPTRVRARSGDRALELVADYPAGRPLAAGFERPIRVYDDGVRIPVRLARPAPEALELSLHAQACSDDGQCLAPAELRVDMGGDSGPAP